MVVGWVMWLNCMLQCGEMTDHSDLESEFGCVLSIICIAKDHLGAPDFVLSELLILWLSDDIYHPVLINCQVYSSKAPCGSAFAHYFSLHVFALDWFFFLSLWCQPPFLCWWYSYICLWFLTAFLFLCLAGIKSLMFQNHIQLKVCKTEFLVMSSLKSETTQLSLSLFVFLPLLTSNFTSNRYPVGYLWLIIVFPDLICMETCLLSWKPW